MVTIAIGAFGHRGVAQDAYGSPDWLGRGADAAPPAGSMPLLYQSTPQLLFEQERGQLIVDVRITGNETVSTDKLMAEVFTRKDREFSPEIVQADKRRLLAAGLVGDVRIYTQKVREGVVVTFEVVERPTLRYVRFHGNRGISDKALRRETGLEVGESLNLYAIQEARRKLEDFYHRKGFPLAGVTVAEGNDPRDRGAVFSISEGPAQRILRVEFVGNTIASDQRLKTQIQSKPDVVPYLSIFRGKVDYDKIEEDLERLTSYYRNLGYFRARVGRQLVFDDAQTWLTLRFVIDEGPRYSVRDVAVAGNERYASDTLLPLCQMQSGEYFNLAKMNRDVNAIRDVYNGNGFAFAEIKAEPRFPDEGSQLDLVYNITEGQRFRVGQINVHISGEYPHTRESVVLDRLSIRPGDIIDIREVRDSERRLKYSQLFENDPSSGKTPRIVIRPPDLSEIENVAERNGRPSIRGQSPDRGSEWQGTPQPIQHETRRANLDVYVHPPQSP